MRYCGKYGWEEDKGTNTCESTAIEVGGGDICSPNPCNYGVCTKSSENLFSCSCWEGYEGERCDEEINECKGNKCIRGGCIDGRNSYECNCPERFDGTYCEIDLQGVPELIHRIQWKVEYVVQSCMEEDTEFIANSIAYLLDLDETGGLIVEPGRCVNNDNEPRRILDYDDTKHSNIDIIKMMEVKYSVIDNVKEMERRRLDVTQRFDVEIQTNRERDMEDYEEILADDILVDNLISQYVNEKSSDITDGISFVGGDEPEYSTFETDVYYQWTHG
eukprot:UN33673